MSPKDKIQVLWAEITLYSQKNDDYISLTDIARYKNAKFPRYVIQNWMKTRFSVKFLWLWEQIYNPNFNRVEFDTFKNESGSNSFVLTPKQRIEKTNAIWIISKAWRYWWTYAHKNIAFEFASRISAEFKLYLITEFQRLKEQENKTLERSVKRELTKQWLGKEKRYDLLSNIAINQMKILFWTSNFELENSLKIWKIK